ncbi:hypothetical protein BH11PLA2_BH11PLA2_35970 [soil metagenome]
MEVQHFIAALDAEQLEPTLPVRHVLRGVGFTFEIPVNVEFPLDVRQFYFFVRIYRFVGSARFRLKLYWHPPLMDPQRVGVLTTIPYELSAIESASDLLILWENLSLPGPGIYEFRLTAVENPKRILAREYLEVRFQ